MQNVAPKRVVSRRANQMYTIAFVLGAAGIFAMAVGLLMALVPLDKPAHPSYPLYVFARGALIGLGLVALIVAIVLAIRAVTFRKDNDLAQITASALEPYLDNQFTYIRSLNRRQIGYVDALLVGPPGVMVFRLLDVSGAYANDGANWMKRRDSGEWMPAHISPTREDLADIRRVRAFLDKRGLTDMPIFGVVVFTRNPGQVALQANNPELPITHLANLYTTLQNGYLITPPIDSGRVAAVTRALIE